ncbi:hypothetical protein QW131_33425 [Roseibium salinum]|nr:hypothetical protein [Roseibium salinum]
MPLTLRFSLLAAVLFAAVHHSPPTVAAELIMLEQPGCVWCKRWNEEIGVAYAKNRRRPASAPSADRHHGSMAGRFVGRCEGTPDAHLHSG